MNPILRIILALIAIVLLGAMGHVLVQMGLTPFRSSCLVGFFATVLAYIVGRVEHS